MSLPRVLRSVARVPLHPFLVAAYPVLFLFAHNIDEQVTLDPLWLPLGLTLGVTAAVFVGLGLLLRDWMRAALLVSLGAALFFGYGHVWNLVREWLDAQWLLLLAWGAAAVVGGWLILTSRRWRRQATLAITMVAFLGVALNTWTIGAYGLTAGGLVGSSPTDSDAGLGLDPERRPDVYYLIFDRYTGQAALADEYGFDNRPFLEQLEQRGFYVAAESHANYTKTPFSLASSLSMDFLAVEPLVAAADSESDKEPIYSQLRAELAVPHAFTEMGYDYHHVASWWEPSATNVDADRVYRYTGQSEFAAALRETTLLHAFSDRVELPDDPWDWQVLREHSLYELGRLDEIPSLPGPKYVFAHLLVPHDPYVFDIDGSFTGREIVRQRGQTESYLRQLQYLNRRIISIVDTILAESDEPPIIILQADEGAFPDRYRQQEAAFDWREATEAELEEKFGILNAIHLPVDDPEAAGLYQTMTPVNTFRVVFNSVFGADLPLLPDRIYTHVSLQRYYDFIEITDRFD